MAVGSCCAPAADASKRPAMISLILLSGPRRFSRGHASFVIFLIEIVQADPGEAHFIDRPLAIADPVFRIGIMRIVVGIVVPRRNVDHRTGWQQRRDLLCIRIRDAPAELIVAYATDRLCSRRSGPG